MHVLGIDAGGTKTVCLLADERGAIEAEGRGPGANLQGSGELAVEKVLFQVMEAAVGDRVARPAAICLGIAGGDRGDDARTVRAVMRRISPGSRLLVVNDALIALVAAAGSAPGIVVIAGTGSIALRPQPGRRGGQGRRLGRGHRRRGQRLLDWPARALGGGPCGRRPGSAHAPGRRHSGPLRRRRRCRSRARRSPRRAAGRPSGTGGARSHCHAGAHR